MLTPSPGAVPGATDTAGATDTDAAAGDATASDAADSGDATASDAVASGDAAASGDTSDTAPVCPASAGAVAGRASPDADGVWVRCGAADCVPARGVV